MTLIVEGQRIPAHKVILAASSDYFRALLYGGMREANQVYNCVWLEILMK